MFVVGQGCGLFNPIQGVKMFPVIHVQKIDICCYECGLECHRYRTTCPLLFFPWEVPIDLMLHMPA